MKKNIFVDGGIEALVVTKSFYKKACEFGSAEYYELRKAKAENEGYAVVFKCDIANKTTYGGLGFKRMEAYIKTQPNAEANLAEFEAVKKIAKIKGSAYPLTKKWFLTTFPAFKENEVSDAEKAEMLTATVKTSAPKQTEQSDLAPAA